MAGIFRYNLGADYDGVGDGDVASGIGVTFATLAGTSGAVVGAILEAFGSQGIAYSDGSASFTNGFAAGNVALVRSNAGYLFDFSGTQQLAVFVGGDFGDVLRGGDALDNLRGGGGNDQLQGNAADDQLDGGGGNDIVDGGAQNDTIDGRDGNDDLTGGRGDDEIDGGAGNDRVIGSAGRDMLTGGRGNDNFIFLAQTNSGTTAATRDIIGDFTKGQDVITLSPIDANAGTAANDAFVLLAKGISNTPVGTGRIGFYWEDYAGTENDKTVLRLNTDGDATIEMTIEVSGHVTFTASDFVL